MKIVIFIHSLGGGGAERVTAHMSRWWADHGHEVTIATIAAADSRYEIDPRVRIIALDSAGESSGPLTGLLANLKRLWAMRALMRRLEADCAIGMMTHTAVLLAFAAAGSGVRTLGSERTYPPAVPRARVWTFLRKIAYRQLDVLVMQTEAGAEWARRDIGRRDVCVIPNPVVWPLAAGEPIVDPGHTLRRSRRFLVTAGRMHVDKDFPALVRIFGRVAPAHPDWDLVILGEGEEQPQVEATAAALGLDGRVLLPGRVGNIGDWLQAADVFVLTSRLEGFPNVLLEARICGLPVVSFDCKSGPADILTDAEDGFLLPPGDEAGFAEALGRLMANDGKRAAMGAAQGKIGRFDLERVMGQWSAIIGANGAP